MVQWHDGLITRTVAIITMYGNLVSLMVLEPQNWRQWLVTWRAIRSSATLASRR
jgi:hypothetical protein